MGHATRFLAVALLIAGAGAFTRYLIDVTQPSAASAPLAAPQPDTLERTTVKAPPAATFTSSRPGPKDSPLTIEFLGSEPYDAGAARDALSISLGAQENRLFLKPGAEASINGELYRVVKLRTWQGLLPIADGAAMASISLLPGDVAPIENILLRTGQRLDIDATCSLELRACNSRDDALARIAAEPRDTASGRWGIVDATGVIWFEGFTPGAGATLIDGSLMTLESFDPSGPTLVVRKRTRESSETLRVEGESNRPPVLLEFGGNDVARLMLYVIEDGRALVSPGMREAEPTDLAEGETWDVPGGRLRLRLEQALRSAAPVDASESPFFEAVLEAPERRVRVRQGEAVRVGDALLRYVRAPDNATAAFRLRVVRPDTKPVELNLFPGGTYDFEWAGGVWRIAHADVAPGERITIRRAGPSSALLIAGVAFVVAAVCLIAVGPRRASN